MGEHRAQNRESLASGIGGLDVTVDRMNSGSHRDRFHCPLISGFWVPNQAGAQTSFIQEDGNEKKKKRKKMVMKHSYHKI